MLPVLPKRSHEAGRQEGPGAAPPRRDPSLPGTSLQGAMRGLPLGAPDVGTVAGAPLSASSVDIPSLPNLRGITEMAPAGVGTPTQMKWEFNSVSG